MSRHPYYDLAHPALDSGQEYRVAPWPGSKTHLVGVDPLGRAALLLDVPSGDDDAPILPPVRLRNLEVDHGVTVTLLSGADPLSRERMTIVRCVAEDPGLTQHFLDVADQMVRRVGEAPSEQEVRRAISHLRALFRPLSSAPQATAQGLWAELFLIQQAADPTALARAWRAQDNDRFDFNAGEQRIEVKSFKGTVRAHHFSHRQLEPIESTSVLVASIRAEEVSGGLSLQALTDSVLARLVVDEDGNASRSRPIGFWGAAAQDRFRCASTRRSRPHPC